MLFYLAPDETLMAVGVSDSELGAPAALFRTRATMIGRNSYVAARDGQRFLIETRLDPQAPALAVVVNWPAVLTGQSTATPGR